jgi:hypothetical protein
VEGSCEHGIELSGSIKCWEVPEELHNWLLVMKGSRQICGVTLSLVTVLLYPFERFVVSLFLSLTVRPW